MKPAFHLMPESLAKTIPALYVTENLDEDRKQVWAHFFVGGWDWYVLEYDPEERRCFGLVSGHEVELGYFTIDELEEVGIVERDLYWTPVYLASVRVQIERNRGGR